MDKSELTSGSTALSNASKTLTVQGTVVPLLLAVLGVGLTLAAFVFANIYTSSLIEEEYENITEQTTQVLLDKMENLKSTLEITSNLVSGTNISMQELLGERFQTTISGLDAFDQLIYVYKKENSWNHKTIYIGSTEKESGVARSVQISTKFLSHLLSQISGNEEKTLFLTDLPGLNQKSAESLRIKIFYKPVLVYAPVQDSHSEQAMVLGVSSLNSISDISWFQNLPFLSRMTVIDSNTAELLFDIQNLERQDKSDSVIKQTYEISTGQEKWEVSVHFHKYQRLLLLENIAPFVLIFGLILTVVATLYARNHILKSSELTRMYRELERKNLDLEQKIKEKADIYETLKKSEQENKAIIDSVSDVIFELDEKGHLLFISAAWRQVTGFSVKQSLDSNLFSLLKAEDQNQQLKDFTLLLQGQKEPYHSFTKLRGAEGHFRAVELAFSVIRKDESGRLRVVGTITDIEDRRKAERALGEAEKKYRAIVENAPSGIYQLTPEGLYLSANPAMARILGYDSPEEMLNTIKNANQSVYANARARASFTRELEEKESINHHETQVFKKDGRKIWISESARAVRDEHGNILYYEGSIEDITARKAQEEELQKAKLSSDLSSRAKSEFLTNMSHELRTPLNSIIGFSDIIVNQAYGPIEQKEYRDYAQDIYNSGKRLLEIINEILDISKIEAGERELNEERVDIHKVTQTCLELYSAKIEANQMEVTDMLRGVPRVIGEELAIKQVVINLISNAVKFTPSGGRLVLSYEVDKNGSLIVSFTDAGIGLDEEEIEKALSPFGQIDSELARSGSGTGLGLTLVGALMKLHGGRLELFSQKGIGTTASVIFPVDRVTIPKDSENPYETSET